MNRRAPNPISTLHEHAQRAKAAPPKFTAIYPGVFAVRCAYAGRETTGTGPDMNAAKRAAAAAMIRAVSP